MPGLLLPPLVLDLSYEACRVAQARPALPAPTLAAAREEVQREAAQVPAKAAWPPPQLPSPAARHRRAVAYFPLLCSRLAMVRGANSSARPPTVRVTMPEEQPDRKEQYRTQLRATVVGGLIVAGIVGAVGLLISQLSGLSLKEVLFYVGLPAFGLALLVGAALVARRDGVLSTRRSFGRSPCRTKSAGFTTSFSGSRSKDVIGDAHVRDWSVYVFDGGDGLTFESPDGTEVFMEPTLLQPDEAAMRLHQAAPEHFPDKWMPSPARNVLENDIALRELAGRVDGMDERLNNAGHKALELKAAVAIATSDPQVRAVLHRAQDAGWSVDQTKSFWAFTRGDVAVRVPKDASPEAIWNELERAPRKGSRIITS